MALSRKVRATFATMKLLTKVGVLPSAQRAAALPVAKRLAFGPGPRMTGKVPDVPSYDVQVPTRDGAEVRVRVYAPEGATAPVLYAHGGGFAIGGLKACDHICRRLAVEGHAVVVSVEYRLAPEHRFPGPLNDCEDALDWLLAQGWDAARLVVGGDSAGGNLAAALSLRLRDRGTPQAGQLLIYPAVDMTLSTPGARSYRGVGLSSTELELCADLYVGEGDRTDPFCSPLLAPDLSGLAPALVITVDHDPLHDEGVAYAGRLLEAGVPTRLLEVVDHVHGSFSVPSMYSGIDEVHEQMAGFVRDPSGVRA
ncbi:MAG: Esterase/lipase/thioesterase [Frankiales bacterium]|nr:Esterase/lipase/thioesterase [Frankiales bacterium]